jgi:p-hydroxybenzoate 3-monooxygenase
MFTTQVAIIGGGPAGLLLSHLLHLDGIDSVVLERQSRDHVLQRIRAGVLESGTVKLLREVGLGKRMDQEGHVHDGTWIAWEDRPLFLIDTMKFTGKQMMAFGQTAITEELYQIRMRDGGQVIHGVENVKLHDVASERPYVTFEHDGVAQRLHCEIIAGCDGFQPRCKEPSSAATRSAGSA